MAAAVIGTTLFSRLSPPFRMPTARPARCRKSRSTSAEAATEPTQAWPTPITRLTARSADQDVTRDMPAMPTAISSAPVASTRRAPIRSVSCPAKATTEIIAIIRAVMVKAKSLRFQAKSATIAFISTDTAMESAECAVTARTPTASAIHACHDSPSGPRPFARHAVP